MSIEELLQHCFQRNIPFYSYRLPLSEDVCTGIQKEPEVSVFDGFEKNTLQNGFLIAPFSITKQHPPLFIKEDYLIINEKANREAEKWIISTDYKTQKTERQEKVLSKAAYLKDVENLKKRVREDLLSKVVYSRVIQKENRSGENIRFYRQLLDNYPNAFVYFFFIPGKAVWMGATHEKFLLIRDGLLQTSAVAGTKKNTDDFWSKKEYEEQEYVARFIREAFRNCDLSDITENGPYTLNAGVCSHLCTDFFVKADLSDSKTEQLITRLHPTPAVCGYPQQEAMKVIQHIEKHDRQFYAGFLGPVKNNRHMDLYVNLRCMKIGEKIIELFVGGGITRDSIPEAEWDETELKSKTILDVICP